MPNADQVLADVGLANANPGTNPGARHTYARAADRVRLDIAFATAAASP